GFGGSRRLVIVTEAACGVAPHRDLEIQQHRSTAHPEHGVLTDEQRYVPRTVARTQHSVASMGRCSPSCTAVFLAASYPASACRATPMPGSLVRTRSIRRAASGVPS